jgi:hypothetical protein
MQATSDIVLTAVKTRSQPGSVGSLGPKITSAVLMIVRMMVRIDYPKADHCNRQLMADSRPSKPKREHA